MDSKGKRLPSRQATWSLCVAAHWSIPARAMSRPQHQPAAPACVSDERTRCLLQLRPPFASGSCVEDKLQKARSVSSLLHSAGSCGAPIAVVLQSQLRPLPCFLWQLTYLSVALANVSAARSPGPGQVREGLQGALLWHVCGSAVCDERVFLSAQGCLPLLTAAEPVPATARRRSCTPRRAHVVPPHVWCAGQVQGRWQGICRQGDHEGQVPQGGRDGKGAG